MEAVLSLLVTIALCFIAYDMINRENKYDYIMNPYLAVGLTIVFGTLGFLMVCIYMVYKKRK